MKTVRSADGQNSADTCPSEKVELSVTTCARALAAISPM